MELFVYVSMRVTGEQQVPEALLLGETEDKLSDIRLEWAAFDALQCRCFNPSDKVRIMMVISSGDGGITGFNKRVADMAAVVFQSVSESTVQVEDESEVVLIIV